MDDATLADWNFTIRNELTLSFVASQAVWPVFRSQKRGVIINIASWRGHCERVGGLPSVAHGVANAGLIALSRTLAAEGAPYGIRALSISPGPIRNPNIPNQADSNFADDETTDSWNTAATSAGDG